MVAAKELGQEMGKNYLYWYNQNLIFNTAQVFKYYIFFKK